MKPYCLHPDHFSWSNFKGEIIDLFMHALLLAAIIVIALLLGSCGTTRQVAIVDRIHQDTIYINQTQYDSIFINQYHAIDRGSDTIYVEDVKVEYRYRVLRDTVRIHQVDSIPVIKEVEITKEVRYIPWWSKALNWIGAISLIIIIVYLIFKFASWKIKF